MNDQETPCGTPPVTFFASPQRSTPEQLQQQVRSILGHPVADVVLDAVCGLAVILNENRQIIAANRDLMGLFGERKGFEIIGKRPGELLECDHVQDGPNGCGTSEACRHCGAVLAILAAQNTGAGQDGECCVCSSDATAPIVREFRVKVTPLVVGAHSLLVVVFQDISSHKRKEVLERVFIHNIRNTIGGLIGWSELLGDGQDEKAAVQLVTLSEHLREEIDAHIALTLAETGELQVHMSKIEVSELFDRAQRYFECSAGTAGRELVFETLPVPVRLVTDKVLVNQVLVNMIKNALEASPVGATVKVRCLVDTGEVIIAVENPGYIPESVAQRMFERSFSTKQGTGRGIGTYSMRLFAQKYLGGTIRFVTSAELKQTTFFLHLKQENL